MSLDIQAPRPISFVNVNRVEVIDDTGRAFVGYYPTGAVEIDVQDSGRTLKIFVGEPPAHPPRSGPKTVPV